MEKKILRLSAKDYEQTRMGDLLSGGDLSDGARHMLKACYEGYFIAEPAGTLKDGTVVINTDVLPPRFEEPLKGHENVEHRAKHSQSGATKSRLQRIVESVETDLPVSHVLGVHKEYRIAQRDGVLSDLHRWHTTKLQTLPVSPDFRKRETNLRDKIFDLVKK